MRRASFCALALTAALLAASARWVRAEEPTVVQVGWSPITINGGFAPKALPRNELAPAALSVNASIRTLDGSHPPALRELVLELDKNVALSARGLPICLPRPIYAQDTVSIEEGCQSAIVGKGAMAVEIESPEVEPFVVKSKLVAFNGGIKDGVRTVYVHAYLPSPISAAVVTKVKVSKIHNDRYGFEAVATFPKIVGGSGSITFFNLTLRRRFTYKDKKRSYVLAKCPDGHLDTRVTSVFDDGSQVPDSFVRACTPTD